MSKTIKTKLLLTISLTFYFFIAYRVEAQSLKIGGVYRSLDTGEAIEIISKNELELTEGVATILANYNFKEGKLRVTFTVLGTQKVKYFNLTKEGLRDRSGRLFYSTTAYPIAKQKEEQERR